MLFAYNFHTGLFYTLFRINIIDKLENPGFQVPGLHFEKKFSPPAMAIQSYEPWRPKSNKI